MRPISILIVDDEEFARKSLRLKIDSSKLNICRLDEAGDGASALRMASEHTYDIVISDVKMPEMSGLEMIHRMQNDNLSNSYIIVSGYNEFDYAREGLRMGVTDYLLKPVKASQLNSLINDLSQEIVSSEEEASRQLELDKAYVEQQIILQSRQFSILLSDDHTDVENNSELKMQLSPYAPFVIALIQVKWNDKQCLHDNASTYFALKELTDHCFGNMYRLNLNVNNNNEYFALHYCVQVEKSLLSCYKKIINILRSQLNCQLTIGVSSVLSSVEQLPQGWQESLVACRNKLLTGSNQVIFFGDIPILHSNSDSSDKSSQLYLTNLISSKRIVDARKYIRQMIDNYASYSQSYQELIDNILGIYITLLRSYAVPPNRELDRVFLQRLYHLDSTDDIDALLGEYIDHVFSSQDMLSELNGENIVNQAQNYIRSNFHENITLESLSEIYHIHPNYLSRAFKKYANQNFNEYLTSVRMDQAIRLLKQPSLRIQDVSQMLGYADSKYFSKVFKKHYGITPTQLELIKGKAGRMSCDS